MQYSPFVSDIELPFYTALASLKINHDKLDDSTREILGLYEIRSADPPNTSCRLQIHGSALTSDEVPAGYYRAEGMIKNFNTIEEYRNVNKVDILQQSGKLIWDAINDGTIYSRPSLLSSFTVISYADLKKHKFHYWFAFPALHSVPSWAPAGASDDTVGSNTTEANDVHFRYLSSVESVALSEEVHAWSLGVDSRERGFFLARRLSGANSISRPTGHTNPKPENEKAADTETLGRRFWEVSTLSSYENGFFDGAKFEDRFVCFVDPSNYENVPGWMLRNLLVLVKKRWGLDKVQVMRYRDVHSRQNQSRSIVITLEEKKQQTSDPIEPITPGSTMPKVTGWERNAAGKLAGRSVDLTEYLDPQRLADQAVDLNLKLMKWRISPNLDLEKIKQTKCLLLGAGTLGSYVARNLMGWGITKITFVDNGSVSFSNPVRQPLYNFSDCLGGGATKAHRASQALSEIYPGAESAGYALSVPMAGHPVVDVDKTRADFELLQELIEDHDVLFLLMDTRESRWLPTVMGKATGKIVMNAALGFDSFVVMRHGFTNTEDPAAELGCYFCNDVVAPMNSVKDQTLDQQCTVTRPGVASVASALLVELLISVLQHPLGAAAPSPASRSDDRGAHPLGLVPHQIRGFLSTFENLSVVGKSYKFCSACSVNIVDTYKEKGWDFVHRALNETGYVEELSGLKEVQLTAEATAADIEWDEASGTEDELEIA
ncbi:hypothetical protein BDV25DRAFT_133081 [Aspergillus avenaceus]|uniref:Ubiquitin-like modifier-activating enzyme ATG7 n=1 Tax=Aspergillus avenaceus TaxID=36643 RepID=A0A5N6TJ35_ASPAV|nr:hypothetical protein BDV25DRAFT_133081 [Aspergillus avenaceus]